MESIFADVLLIEQPKNTSKLDVFQMLFILIDSYCYDRDSSIFNKYCEEAKQHLSNIQGFSLDNQENYFLYEHITALMNFYCHECFMSFLDFMKNNPALQLSLQIGALPNGTTEKQQLHN